MMPKWDYEFKPFSERTEFDFEEKETHKALPLSDERSEWGKYFRNGVNYVVLLDYKGNDGKRIKEWVSFKGQFKNDRAVMWNYVREYLLKKDFPSKFTILKVYIEI